MAVNSTDTDPVLNQPFISRPYLRDAIRRKIGITPPVDNKDGYGPGVEPAGESWPTNPVVNQCIADSISRINRASGFHSIQPIQIPVPATTTNGPQFVPLTGYGQANVPMINSVRRAVWYDGSSNRTLIPDSFYSMDRNRYDFDDLSPDVPQRYFVTGYNIALVPGTSAAGTLTVYCGTALVGLNTDYDVLDGIPVDYAEVIENVAVKILREMRPGEPGAAQQLQIYSQLEKDGIAQTIRLFSTMSVRQPQIIYGRTRRTRII